MKSMNQMTLIDPWRHINETMLYVRMKETALNLHLPNHTSEFSRTCVEFPFSPKSTHIARIRLSVSLWDAYISYQPVSMRWTDALKASRYAGPLG